MSSETLEKEKAKPKCPRYQETIKTKVDISKINSKRTVQGVECWLRGYQHLVALFCLFVCLFVWVIYLSSFADYLGSAPSTHMASKNSLLLQFHRIQHLLLAFIGSTHDIYTGKTPIHIK